MLNWKRKCQELERQHREDIVTMDEIIALGNEYKARSDLVLDMVDNSLVIPDTEKSRIFDIYQLSELFNEPDAIEKT